MKLCLVTLCLTFAFLVNAQDTERVRLLQVNDTLSIDHIILPSSINFVDYPDSMFQVYHNQKDGTLFIGTSLKVTEVRVEYVKVPRHFTANYSTRQFTDKDTPNMESITQSVTYFQKEQLIPLGEVHSAGSITRGVVVGSNRSMNVTSAMNLNFDGKISEDVSIRASITDQNMPYQPEGNTLRLNQISNVFFELYGKDKFLRAGDLVFKNGETRFLKFNRNVKGISAGSQNTTLGLSVAKGEFTTVSIIPQDGVVGPYRIPPPKGLSFTVVLANSERVYLDGRVLKRGWNNDYIIDYNTGEITFTAQISITRFSRIRVEYEFSNPLGQKATLYGSHRQQIGKTEINFNVFQQKDGKNNYSGIPISDEEKYRFSQLDKDQRSIMKSTVDSVGYSEDAILYEKLWYIMDGADSLVYYNHSTNPATAHFKVLFNYVGDGNGNYIRSIDGTNGIVYEFVPPVAGLQQGQYSVDIQLTAPQSATVMEMGLRVPVNKSIEVYTDLAGSFNNLNRFNKASTENGLAVKSGILYRPDKTFGGYRMETSLDLEFVGKTFAKVERFRSVEFDRDWSFDPRIESAPQDDRILNLSTALYKDSDNSIKYDLVFRNRNNSVSGYQNRLQLNQSLGKFQVRSNAFYMSNRMHAGHSTWGRLFTDVGYRFGKNVLGYRYNIDRNLVLNEERDTIKWSDQSYREHAIYIRNAAEAKSKIEFQYSNRMDAIPIDGEMKDRFLAHSFMGKIDRSLGRNMTLSGVANYRIVEDLLEGSTDHTLSSRIDWKGTFFDRNLRVDVNYSVANGRELRREYIFLKVPVGEGTHTWRDDNQNGVEELNEFYEAVNPDERNYVKVFVPTSEYVNAMTNILNARLNLRFPASWSDSPGIRKLLSKFSAVNSWSSNTKHNDPNTWRQIFSTHNFLEQEYLLAGNHTMRSTLFFNRSNPFFGFDVGFFSASRKTLLREGFESTDRTFVEATIRLQPEREYGLRLFVNSGSKVSASDVVNNRDFEVDHFQVKPTVIWQPSQFLRVATSYQLSRRWDVLALEQPSNAVSNEAISELRISKSAQSTFQCQIRVIDIKYSGELNTPVSYELLQALQPGMNTTMSISWIQKIIGGLQMTMSYDGRKSGDAPLVHTGRMAVTALF